MGKISTRRMAWTAAISAVLATGLLAGVSSGAETAEETVFIPVTPCRLVDTRPGSDNVGPRSSPLRDDETVSFTATADDDGNSLCEIPVTARAIVANVTSIGPTAPSFLTFYPADQPRPGTSTLNLAPGQAPTPNGTTIPLSTAGAFNAYNAFGEVDLIVDVSGYFQPSTGGTAGPAGPQGAQGEPGPAGEKGDQGDPGEQGLQGPAGADGADGDDGAQGPPGADGADGDDGADGAQGPPGADGDDGAQGPPGADGADGDDLFTRTIVVNSGNTGLFNGLAYVAALNEAIASSPSTSSPIVILVEPGTYNFTSAPPTIPSGVHIQGSGLENTTLTCSGCTVAASTGTVWISDLTMTSTASSETADLASARLERLLIENTNTFGDALVASGGDLTILDSTLRTRPNAETGISQYGALLNNMTIDFDNVTFEGYRPRFTASSTSGTIENSRLVNFYFNTGSGDIEILNSVLDTSLTELSGGGLITLGTSNSATLTLYVGHTQMRGYGTINGFNVGENSTAVVEHSSLTGGRFIGSGSVEARYVAVDDPFSVTTETCFAITRIDTGTFLPDSCP